MMSDPKLISPMLDNFMMGDPVSEHHGVRCCPAMENGTDDRYIVKIISVPANPAQMDALLLTGAYKDENAVLDYFKEITDGVVREVNILNGLAELEGFIPYTGCQVEPMESGKGFDIYLLSRYKRSLEKHFKRHIFTHLDALNLGLDLCAALSVCRRSGYLYVDLKPGNVFVTDERLYRIGDLGFIPLDSLQYAFLPEKYISAYTPPEIRDAFSALNTTMDIYAAGLILYQTYNNGILPFNDEIKPGDSLPAPMYADYEMSEIILKACSANPEDRWQDPMQMGQAIVSYMQRNGAKDEPIVPTAEPEDTNIVTEEKGCEVLEEATEAEVPHVEESQTEEPVHNEVTTDDIETVSYDAEILDLSFLDEEDDLDEDGGNYENVTEEVSEMLSQADDLAAAEVPEPVVVPKYVEVSIPEIIKTEAAQEEPQKLEDTQESPDGTAEEYVEPNEQEEPVVEKTNRNWLRNSLLVLLVLALLASGYFFYTRYYLLPIDSIAIDGNEDTLTVYVNTDIDDSLLSVVCSDTYGNKIPAPVVNGKAEFTGLVPNTAYNVKIVANGFHRLSGNTATAYSTPIQTNIVRFDAVTGMTDGSVILSFTVEGPDCKEWSVQYSADGEEARTATFSSHMVTLTDLTIDKEYTFKLAPKEQLYVTGQEEIKFVARKLVKAENLQIISCTDNSLTAKWTAPEGVTVEGWSVLCSNDSYNQTIVTTDTTVTFKDLDHTKSYTVEVKAVGMSVSQVANIPENSVTANNFTIDNSDPTKFSFAWQPSQQTNADGWMLRYSVTGIEGEKTINCSANTATVYPVIPNADYQIRLEDKDGNVLLGSPTKIATPAPVDFEESFDGFTATRKDFEFKMCKTPEFANWGRYDLKDSDYTTTFASGIKASFLVRFAKSYTVTTEPVTTLYVVRNDKGAPILSEHQENTWRDMWYMNNCELDIPAMPTKAGTYTIEVYFNGGLVHSQQFTITE